MCTSSSTTSTSNGNDFGHQIQDFCDNRSACLAWPSSSTLTAAPESLGSSVVGLGSRGCLGLWDTEVNGPKTIVPRMDVPSGLGAKGEVKVLPLEDSAISSG